MRYLEKGKKLREKRYTLSSLDELRDYFSHEEDWESVWVYDSPASFHSRSGGYCHLVLDPALSFMWVESDNITLQIHDRDIRKIYVTGGVLDIYLKGGDALISLGS